jgi:hypothetical protein
MEDLKKFSQAVLNGANIQGPASYIPEVTKYLTAEARQGVSEAAGKGLAGVSEQKASEEKEAAEAARRAKIEQLKDQMDPSKYQKVRKGDGGFEFRDPNGNPIDIDTFARRTGLRRVDVLKDSENALDQQYVNDWNNANDLAQAMYNGDKDTVSAFVGQNPDLRGRKPEDFMRELARKYPHMYGLGKYEDTLRMSQGRPAFKNNGYGGGGGGSAFAL